MRQWNKGPRLNGAVTSEEWVDIGRIFRKTVELEIEKCIIGSLTGLLEVSD
jgi:hypothetical protein